MLISGYPIRLFILMRTVVAVYSRIEFNDWHCGSSEFTRRMSFESITESCEAIMLPVNHCCVVHDECYTQQHGQEKCDEDFCECNRRASIMRPDCQDLLEASCSLVQLFGFGAYRNSINYTEPADLAKHTINNNRLKTPFLEVYTHCPKVNATMSSCALQYNYCESTPIECAEALSVCLHDAVLVDASGSCRNMVDALTVLIVEDGNSWRNTLRNSRFLGLNILKFLMVSCLLTLMFYALRLRFSTTTTDEKGKTYMLV